MYSILLTSSVLILVIILLRRLLRGKISLRLQYSLWLLVALRLLIPVEFGESSLSLNNFTQQPQTQITTESPVLFPQIPSVAPSVDTQAKPSEDTQISPPVNTQQVPIVSYPLQIPPQFDAKPVYPQPSTTEKSSLSLQQVLTIVWAVGAAAMALWFAVVNIRFNRRARKHALPVQIVGFPLEVYVTRDIPSPCLLGLIHPRIYLTPMNDGNAQRHVLAHEATHYRHLDPLWSLIRVLCLCLYWFHPLVWWAAILSKQDCELACDEGAIKHLGERERIPYGRTLLCMVVRASRPRDLLQTATTMTESKKQMKERVEMIVKQPKKLFIAMLCMLLVVALTVGCTFTGAKTEDTKTEPTEITEPTEPTETTEATQPTETTPKSDFTDTTVELLQSEGNYRFPKLTLDNETGEEINNEIKRLKKSIEEETPAPYSAVDYAWSVHSNILSLVVTAQTAEDAQSYWAYNIDLLTGEYATVEQLHGTLAKLRHAYNMAASKRFAEELFARYISTGSLSYDAQTDAYYCQNIAYRESFDDVPCWIDENGIAWAAVDYYAPNGENSLLALPLNVKATQSTQVKTAKIEEISFATPTDEFFTESYTLTVPFLLMEGERAAEVNAEILLQYHGRYSETKYSVAENGDILSIAISAPAYENYDFNCKVFNISKTTGVDVPYELVYGAVGMDAEEYRQEVKAVLLNQSFRDRPESLGEISYEAQVYERTVSDHNVFSCIPYLDRAGKLCMKATVYQIAGGECTDYLLPITDCQWNDRYLEFISSLDYSVSDYLSMLPEDVSGLLPIVEAAQRRNISPTELYSSYLQQLVTLGDSAAWQSCEYEQTEQGLLIYGGILHETPMNLYQEDSLAGKVAAQYRYWQENGTIGGWLTAETEPYYQVKTITIDASDVRTSIRICINGVDFGRHSIDNSVFFLEVDSEAIAANEPVKVEITLHDGEMPDSSKIFIGVDSNISGAR